MAFPKRVLNITSGWKLKQNQAVRAVESCSAAWVEEGVSIRNLTLAESIAKRNEQAKLRDPEPDNQREPGSFAEIRGIVFRPPAGWESVDHLGRSLRREASSLLASSAKENHTA